MKKSKSLGQVFTPEYVVNIMLDQAGFKGKQIAYKSVLEPSFGNGAILSQVVKRLISEYKAFVPMCQIPDILEETVYGIEIEPTLVEYTKNRLNAILSESGLPCVKWKHLYCQNTLLFTQKNDFNYIIGNPPYIRIHNLDESAREAMKGFSLSNGCTDMYILFFEKCLKLLKEDGTLCFITPNSFMKNTSQKTFRKYITQNQMLLKLINFKDSNVFSGFSVYPAISVLGKNHGKDFEYSEYKGSEKCFTSLVSYNSFITKNLGGTWNFGSDKENRFLAEVAGRDRKLGDICVVQNGIETNSNRLYIGDIQGNGKTVLFNGEKVERAMLNPVVKGRNFDGKTVRHILFPYAWNSGTGRFDVLSEDVIKSRFPLAWRYFLKHKARLEQRDLEPTACWYQFGRSQGLSNGKKKKLVVKDVIAPNKKTLEVFEVPEDTLVYTGVFVTAEEENFQKVKRVLTSEEFCTYCKLKGKDMSGGYKRVNTKIIKEYGIPEK